MDITFFHFIFFHFTNTFSYQQGKLRLAFCKTSVCKLLKTISFSSFMFFFVFAFVYKKQFEFEFLKLIIRFNSSHFYVFNSVVALLFILLS